MKIPQKHNRLSKKKMLIIVLCVFVVIVGSLFGYLYITKASIFGWAPFKTMANSTGSIDYRQPTEDQKAAGNSIKQNSANSIDPDGKPVKATDRPAAPTPQPDGKSKVDVSITAANQNGNVFQVRSDIGTVTAAGTCTLTLVKNDSKVTKIAGVQALSSTSTCQGFDIQTSELSAGTWQLSLLFENTTLTGNTSQVIVIK